MADTPTTPAIAAIQAAGMPHDIVRTERAGSAEEAATLQGIPLGALLRTIVVRRGDDDYLFVLVPAGRRFEWPRLPRLVRLAHQIPNGRRLFIAAISPIESVVAFVVLGRVAVGAGRIESQSVRHLDRFVRWTLHGGLGL